MPQRRSIKNAIVKSLVFLGLFASLGHMTVNFWEKFMIQSELVHMKTSLHSLKETITHIGAAYNSLHRELRYLIEVAEKQHPSRLKNIEHPAQAVRKLNKTVKNDTSVAKQDKAKYNEDLAEYQKLEASVNTKTLNAATVTKNSLKSVEIINTNMDPTKSYERGDGYSVNEPHDCLYGPEYKYCRHCNQFNHPYHNWRV